MPRKPDKTAIIGHYGCSAARRLVKVRRPRRAKKPKFGSAWRVLCPACGSDHIVVPTWRKATRQERALAEVTLGSSAEVRGG